MTPMRQIRTATVVPFVTILFCLAISLSEGLSAAPQSGNVFVRFSPLIGGPSFLPLHCEVLLLAPPPPANEEEENTILIHRFDFLPKEPTRAETLSSLLSLQSVPGMVRQRTLNIPSSSWKEIDRQNDNDDDDSPLLSMAFPVENAIQAARTSDTSTYDETTTEERFRRGYTFCLGRKQIRMIQSSNNAETSCSSLLSSPTEMISEAQSYSQTFQSQNGQLHILYNSCFNYAFGLIQNLRHI
eukprot:CAMPEP_0185738894 /NCGR_PEP_ID=MMETSP1171-20130828/34123_1 /TAXON_ID=374046 /ORGANISM="Helicotheca tamensis, Strain CCMP826" /LENGTH=241 /DNA_ID=CAMNT_0028410279 /DNA_START=19 /DNA_END=744 /DNA_ORIENTATION=-